MALIMKKLLISIFVLASFALRAANPSFADFRGTQFDVTGNKVAITNNAVVTNFTVRATLLATNHSLGSGNGNLRGNGGYAEFYGASGGLQVSQAAGDQSGHVIAGDYTGSGALLTALNADNISSGTVPAARLPALGLAYPNALTNNDTRSINLAGVITMNQIRQTNAAAGSSNYFAALTNVFDGGITLPSITATTVTGNGAGLTNLTYNLLTNAINTGVLPVGKTTFTNITGNITIAGVSGVDLNFNQWAKLWVTNSTSTDYKVTFPASVCTATNAFVVAQDVFVTNKSAATIMVDIAAFGTNAAAVRFQR